MLVYQVAPSQCLHCECYSYDGVSVNSPSSYQCARKVSHIWGVSRCSADLWYIPEIICSEIWLTIMSLKAFTAISPLLGWPLCPSPMTTSVNKGKCSTIRQDWMISGVSLVAWWSSVSQSLPLAAHAHLLTHPRENSWIAMSDEFLPYSGHFSVIMLTGLLSVPLRGKSVENLRPFNFTFELLESSLPLSDIRCLNWRESCIFFET